MKVECLIRVKENTMRVSDMTSGNPLPLIISFAVPLLIGNTFQQIYGLVDTMVAGHNLGDNAIAAIGSTAVLFNLLIGVANNLNGGYAIVVTQKFGAHDGKKLKTAIAGMIELNLLSVVILTTLSLLFLDPMLHFMSIPDAIYAQAYRYIAVVFIGIGATVGYNMFAAIMRAFGNSVTSLVFLIFSSCLNIVLDIVFVVVLKFGVEGTAIATVLAQAAAAVFSGAYVIHNYRPLLPGKQDWHVPMDMIGKLLSHGLGMAMMMCVVHLSSLVYLRANNQLGEVYITAQTSARRIVDFTMTPLGTIATAGATFTGQNWGAQKMERIRHGMRQTMYLEFLWSGMAIFIIFAFGSLLERLITGTDNAEIIRGAILYMRWHVSFYPILGMLLALRMCMQSMGVKLAPILSSCVELSLKIAAAFFVIPKVGFIGICVTEPLTWIFMQTYLGLAYLGMRKKLYRLE